MKLYIKQKVFTFRDKFTVKDERENDVYSVWGELLSLGKKLHIEDAAGAEVALVREKWLSFLPRYDVFAGEERVLHVKKEFTLFRPRYTINDGEWEISGSFLEHDYELRRGGAPVARISKAWMTWGDSYELDIAPGVPELYVLACVLAIDAATAPKG